ncbi:hypothetical protein M3Y99_00654200 [Aphelenchoides fujianensis]|nr:hypothetical protein M3Y99_00654200 [Aphelenchoides fujianensis]
MIGLQSRTPKNLNSRNRSSGARVKNSTLSALFTLIDDNDDRGLYGVDYSQSHPFENSCRFPILRPEEADIRRYATHSRAVVCPAARSIRRLVVQLRTGKLVVNPSAMSANESFECFARTISGTLRPAHHAVHWVGEWVRLPVNRRFKLHSDQVAVECFSRSNATIFFDVFADIPAKEHVRSPSIDGTPKLSLSVLAIDSTSRSQFFRHMPATLRFMRKHDFQILRGYNKIGDNSAINIFPLCSCKRIDDKRISECLVAGKVFDAAAHGLDGLTRRRDVQLNDSAIFEDPWKHANFLTKQVRDRGGATLWQDDVWHADLGLLNYDKFLGFHAPPADSYYRPYFELLYGKTEVKGWCVNGEFVIPRWLGLWERFSTRYAKQWNMAFSFLTTLTHDSAHPLELLDSPLEVTLRRMERAGVFENTALVIMGDHGQRVHEIQRTFTGRIEERQPIMALYLPPKFRSARPDWYAALKTNKNRLVSNFDLHETFRQLLQLEDADRTPVGRSLFTRVLAQRSCEDARIPEQHCLCMREEALELNARTKVLTFLNVFDYSFFQQRMVAFVDDYAAWILRKLECVRGFKLEAPTRFVVRTLNPQVRAGTRVPATWIERLNEKAAAQRSEIFDVEFESKLRVQTKDQSAGFRVRSRVFFNPKTGEIWRNAESFVHPLDPYPLDCTPLVLENVYSCSS